MRRWTTFSWLLTSLVALVAATVAVPVHNDEPLTPDNFQNIIASGVWMVKYYSPYCGHCQAFAPTWDTIVQETKESSPNPGIDFAEIDCTVYGDFCSLKEVTRWPSIMVYKDGESVEEFKGARSIERLQEFVAKHAEPSHAGSNEQGDTPMAIPLNLQDRRQEQNLQGVVTVLDESTFPTAMNQGPLFVKFYAPWCGHCKKLAPVWAQLAKRMQHTLAIAEVNCEDHASLCATQGVQGYPVLYFYANGIKAEYTGGRKLEQLKAFADRASAPPVQELVPNDLDKHIEENPVLYLLLLSSSDTQILTEVRQASQVLLGSPPIYASTSRIFFERFSIPTSSWALVALKDHDGTAPSSTFSTNVTTKLAETVKVWLLLHRLPTTMELDQDSFQSVMNADHHPLVVIVANPSGSASTSVLEKLHDIGAKWRTRQGGKIKSEGVVFTWMDGERWAKWLKGMYGVEQREKEVALVIADHGRLLYWDRDKHGQKLRLTSSSIFSALDGIESGTIKAKHSENIVERMVRVINGRLTVIEQYISNYPLRFASFLAICLLFAFVAIKGAFKDDTPGRTHSRLD